MRRQTRIVVICLFALSAGCAGPQTTVGRSHWLDPGENNKDYSIDLNTVSPPPGEPVVRGSSVAFRVAASYKMTKERAKIMLVFEDEKNTHIGPKGRPVSAEVSEPAGNVTLQQTIEIPEGSKEVVIFVPMMPDGMKATLVGPVIRYPIVAKQ